MAITNNDKPHSLTHIWNEGFDRDNQLPWIQNLKYVPGGNNDADFERDVSDNLLLRVDDTSEENVTYIGDAPIGTATTDSYWRILKIDETTGLVITYAGGNAEFTKTWDDRTSLSYS